MKEYLMDKNLDNRGMSLVEMIIVVAIMSAMISVTGFGISMISGRPAEQCAQKLCSALQHARTITMGKNTTSITISMNANGQIVAREESVRILDMDGNIASEGRESVVADKGVSVSFLFEDGTSEDLTAGTTLLLGFDRGSGALQTTQVNGMDKAACIRITISKANTTRYIVITPVTGKVSVTSTP